MYANLLLLCISELLNLWRLMTQNLDDYFMFENVCFAVLKRVCILLFWDDVVYKHQLGQPD